MSSHTSTHMDACMHFISSGWTMEAPDLSRSVGPYRVVDLTHVEGHIGCRDLEPEEVAGQISLLLKTRNSKGWLMQREGFEEGYSTISKEVAEYLVEIGVETIGVDYLPIEPFEDCGFNTHHTLLGAGVVILEGLALTEVEPGGYFLTCLPL